jgi:hypothetical protein
MLKDSNGRPDILVLEQSVSPVAIECELEPAIKVESEAKSRLGEHIRSTGREIFSAIAVRYPSRMKTKSGAALQRELARANDLAIALFIGTGTAASERWPNSGWILGNIADLSIFVQSASVPPAVIEKALTNSSMASVKQQA